MNWLAEYDKGIREAYAFLREKNSTIPNEILKFMLDATLEKLREIELQKVNQLPQTQEALNDQLRKLWVIANKFGLYDAADYVKPKEAQ